jgi:hypothetical protein
LREERPDAREPAPLQASLLVQADLYAVAIPI